MRKRLARLLPFLPVATLLLVTACGVPISAEEITATAESQRTSQQLSTIGEAAISSRSADASSAATGASPIATLGALGTPAGTGTPGATTTPGASVTPSKSATPGPSTTPGPASLLAAEATGTVTATVTGTPEATGTPGTPTVTSTASPQPTAGVPTSDFGAQVVNLVNEYRVANGRSRLTPDAYITTASNNYAKLMGTSNTFGHTGPDGSSSEGRMSAAGYGGDFCGENIAAGQTTPQEAFNVWKSSPAHNSIMLAANPTNIGVGYFYDANAFYKHYWVLMTGRPSGQGCPPS
jgi:uncharacterized protein YkwD